MRPLHRDSTQRRQAMHVFLIGAAGGVGRRLAPLLVQRGDTVTGMFRKPSQHDLITGAGAAPVSGDLVHDSVDQLAAKIASHDAVVFSAGAHGAGREQTTLIDGKGLEKASDAAAKAGASRFVLVSAFPDSERASGLGEGFEHYLRVKKAADGYLTRTDLDWVIVRPGHLLDEPGDGLIEAGLALREAPIRRDNLAEFIAAALHDRTCNRIIVEVTDGRTPITEAVVAVARSVGPRR
jgi:nucleoside-diphosphate-sugar epimerase